MKLKFKRALVAISCLALFGCKDEFDGTPSGLDVASRPLVVIANNEAGLILRSDSGCLYTYGSGMAISTIALKQGFKAGDVFCK